VSAPSCPGAVKKRESSPPINPIAPFTAIFIFCLFDKFALTRAVKFDAAQG